LCSGCSSAFNDFGPKFTCIDATGEQPLTGMIVEVSKVGRAFYGTRIVSNMGPRIRMALLLAWTSPDMVWKTVTLLLSPKSRVSRSSMVASHSRSPSRDPIPSLLAIPRI
jgi:hypothetical protein